MSRKGHAWRKGGHGTLYLGDGTAGQVLTTQGAAERPVVAIYSAAGRLLATRLGHINRSGAIVVYWDGQSLDTEKAGERDPRAPTARYRATLPAREET